VIASLAQFDILSNIVAVIAADEVSSRAFYPNFARFRQLRIQPIVEQLLTDDVMRSALGVANDESLAAALGGIGDIARNEGCRYNGFSGWSQTPVGAFVVEHLQSPSDEGSPS
jgi:hypothetical protein